MRRILKGTLILCLVLAVTPASLPATAFGAGFSQQSDGWHAPPKDPAATLDYSIDWTQWLAGDTIASSAWTCDSGITESAAKVNAANTLATIWLSGGTLSSIYKVTNTITTAAGRTQVQSFKVTILAR